MFVRKSVLPRSISVFLATIGLLVAALIFACVPALAEEVTGFESPFTFGEFNAPRGAAVDNGSGASAGDVYITDAENHRVVKFNAGGTEQLAELKYTPTPEEEAEGKKPLGVVFWDAVDPNTGDVYASNIGGGAVTKFSPTGTFLSQITEATVETAPVHAGFAPTGVAVDGSGKLYAADLTNHVIDRFSAAGVYETQFADESNTALSIAVDTSSGPNSGDIYVTDAELAIKAFSAAGTPVTPAGCASNVIDANNPLGVAVDPLDGAVIVSEGGEEASAHLARYQTPCGEPLLLFGEGSFIGGSKGIAVSTTHKHDVYAVSDGGTTANLFKAEITTGAEEVIGFESPFTFGEFNAPRGAAVDNGSGASAGDVYITDAENHRVVKFNAGGTEQLAELKYTPTPEEEAEGKKPLGVVFWDAVDPNTGDVYASNIGGGAVTKFSPTGTFLSQITEATVETAPVHAGFAPTGVAVDGSGKLYAADLTNHVIDRFSAAGVYETQFADESNTALSIAVDTSSGPNSGDIYVTDAELAIKAFSAAGTPVTPAGCASNVIDANNPLGVAVDPLDGAVIVSEGGEEASAHLARYQTPCGEPLLLFGEGSFIGGSKGIAVSTTHKHDVYAVSDGGTTANLFKAEIEEGGPLFKVEDVAAGNITPTSATLNGTVKPEGEEVTGIEFEYGIGNVSENVAVATPATATGSGEVPVHLDLTGLTPNKTYLYRLVGSTTKGGKSAKPTFTVKIPPLATVTTEAATVVEPEGATLNGKIQANVATPAEYYFEYGKVISEKTSPAKGFVSEKTVAEHVSGLEPATRYHARLVAVVEGQVVNGAGSEEPGPEIEFTTAFLKPMATVEPVKPESITRTTALLGGEINPENNETTYHFEYEYTKEGTAYKEQSQANKIPAGSAPVAVGPEALSELKPGTTYHYRLVATNEGGTSTSLDGEFTTAKPELPIVNSGSVSSVTQTTATIGGEINPNGLQTSYILEVGADTTYGTPSFGEVGSGTELVPLGFTLTSLLPDTVYHYRLVGVNEDGTVLGADVAFKTPGFPNPIAEPSHPVIIPMPPEVKPPPPPPGCKKGFVKKHGKCVKKPKKKGKGKGKGKSKGKSKGKKGKKK